MQDVHVITTTTRSRVVERSRHSTRTTIHLNELAAGTHTRVKVVGTSRGFSFNIAFWTCIDNLRKRLRVQ